MSVATLIKRLQDIMRGDDLSGTVQYLRQVIWMIFLKIYDAKEQEWEIEEDDYTSIIPDELKWRNWAVDNKDGLALTGDALIKFVNDDLIGTLKKLEVSEKTQKRHLIVQNLFADAANFMKNGTKLRQLINALNETDFTDQTEAHEFGDIYEGWLKDLQESKRDGGEFYTPRALTDFVVEMVDPRLGDTVADFACGTGGFLISAWNHLQGKINSAGDREICASSLFGIEKKSFPYSLCLTNLILHGIEEPKIYYDNSLKNNVRDYEDKDLFDIIVMNPPYGGSEDAIIQMNFPTELRGSETADLFMAVIMYRLNTSGRVGVVLPDGFLFGKEGAKKNLKEKLLNEFNLHTVLRLPNSVFAPYTSIATNVLFFEKDADGTNDTWFYRLDMPSGYKHFSKTKPIKAEHFQPVRDWWINRTDIQDTEGNFKAKKYTKRELIANGYDFDLCGFPHKTEEIQEPNVLITEYFEKKTDLDTRIRQVLGEIMTLLEKK
jgi:type I restriction enzyme M protein